MPKKKLDSKQLKDVTGGANVSIICPSCGNSVNQKDLVLKNGYLSCPICEYGFEPLE